MCRSLPWVLLLLSQWKVCAVIFILFAYAFFLALVLAACLQYFPPSEGIKSFFAALTIGVSCVTALMSSLVAIYGSKRAEEAAIKLEDYKKEIIGKIEEQKTELAKDLANHNQTLQKELQKINEVSDKELVKLQEITLKREIDVYQDLYAAADHYYLALSKLQSSEWNSAESLAAEAEMQKTRSKLPYMESPDHRLLWERIWTRALTIAKEAKSAKTDDQPALWQKHASEFGGMLQEMEKIVTAKYPRPKAF